MYRNKKIGTAFLLLIFGVTSLQAQVEAGQVQPVIEALQDGNGYVQNMVINAAKEMSEDDYSFRPTPEVRNFGELLTHIAGSNYFFCSAAMGKDSPVGNVEKNVTKREEILDVLSASFDYCNEIYETADIGMDTQLVEFMGKQRSPLTVLTFRNNHTLQHYGNVITYMRLRGKVPPSSQRTQSK